jgi:tRNA 2-thiouridine synthesizing protein A
MTEMKVDVRGQTCPVPLVECRKALMKASPGDVVEVVGDHDSSKKEIPMAVDALGLKILGITEQGNVWTIRIQK